MTPREGRKFAFPVGTAAAVFAGIAHWRHHEIASWILAALAAALLVAGAVIPGYLRPVRRGWMRLGEALSKVTTPILMGIIYFIVLTPIALVMRAFGHRPLRHTEERGGFWKSPSSGGRSDLNHQF